ncbi:MAG TPA: carboxypeptidase-like regulatory domain-containing protein [Kofleriaceae bacterium]|nr:carboxypeptidase-like regulatory domain-containing protein [Kofleriaceae bacterium]
MSEDEPPPPPASGSRRRLAVLGAIVLALVAAAVVVLVARPHRAPGAAAARRDGGALVHAPLGPRLPGAPDSGVHLTGFVIDGAGVPVAGAEVSAEPERGAADRALAPRPAAPQDAGAPAIATAPPTGADGRFAITNLEPGRYRLRVTGPGLLAAELRFVPVPSDEARIVVARQVAIDGTVSDGGKPVTAANVGIRGEAIGGTLEVKTDAHGAFHVPNLPEGRYQVYAWQAGLAARTIRVARLGAGPFSPVELRLEAGAIVVGRVVDKDEGTGLVAAVELRPSGEDQAPRYARTGTDGVFRIEGVPSGRWIADAFAPGYSSPGGVELEAGRGVPELDLVRGGAIEGRVLDGDGRPVAGASVRALVGGTPPAELSADVDRDRLRRFSGRTAAPAPDASSLAGDPELVPRGELGVLVGPIPPVPAPGAQVAQPAEVVDPTSAAGSLLGEPPPLAVDPASASIWVTGADGRYRIRGLGKTKVTALAVAAGYAEARSRTIAIEPGQLLPNVDIVLSAGTYLVGKVVDQHGAAVVGAELQAVPELGVPVEGFSDADGAYRLGPVTGAIELRATAYGHVDFREKLELAPAKGTVAAERHEDLVLEVADAVLAGTLEDTTGVPVGGAHLEVAGEAGEPRRALVNPDGTFELAMLPRGHLRVHVEHPDYPPDELDAIASTTGERVRLRIPIGGAIEGALIDASSGEPLAGTTITASGPSGQVEATTDSAGRWKLGPLRPGTWAIEVKLPGYLTQRRELDVPAARAPGMTSVHDVRIELARGAMLGGTVRDGRGQRVPGAHVVVRLADGTGPAIEGDADAQGEFRIHDCPTGDVVVSASAGDASGATRTTVRPGDEVLGLAIDLP